MALKDKFKRFTATAAELDDERLRDFCSAFPDVKAMGDLQQWSWGFRVLATQPNQAIRGNDITQAEIFEVSPVLVGANQHTATLSVKGGRSLTAIRKHLALEQIELERVMHPWLREVSR